MIIYSSVLFNLFFIVVQKSVLILKLLYILIKLCYNLVVLMTYQEQLGYYKKVENRKALTTPFGSRYLFRRRIFMKYCIGLDCGISSVGYSVMELDCYDQPKRIIRLGSRIFNKAENLKDGSSLALPRREARGIRRRLRRYKHRLERIKYMLFNENIISEEELNELFKGYLSDIYELRVKALDEPVSNTEFARILINLAQRRGFKSNRKTDKNDVEAGKLLVAINNNLLNMKEHNYRTVGEMFFKDSKYSKYKRNKGENYLNTVSRSMVSHEISQIFQAQRNFGQKFADLNIENIYTEIVMSQRPFDLGPGEGNANSPSQYYGNQIEKMIGKCTFFPDERRAAKATYSFQLFTLLQNINNITLVNDFGEKRTLNKDEKLLVKDLCFRTASVKYSTIRKQLSIPNDYRFNNLSYGGNELSDIENKTKFEYLKAYHLVKKLLKDAISVLSIEQLDLIGYIFTVYKNDDKILNELKKSDIDRNLFDTLLNLPSFSKFGHISIKACKKIIPYLEKGMTYSDACEEAGINFKSHNLERKSFLLPAKNYQIEEITNPVVKRAVSQTIKVVNAIIREQGYSPTYLNIELARELSKSKKERDTIEKQNIKNREINNKIISELYDNFKIIYPSGQDIVKLKLWHEQDGIDPYSLNQIKYDLLFDDGYVDIDHIIPYSCCFDDSYNNKVLTFSKENRQKGNKIPMEYIPNDKKSDYQVWVNNNVRNFRKKQNLLKIKLTKDDFDSFKVRNLNDTKYLSKVLYNYINDNLKFTDFVNGGQKHVTSVNGAVTAYIRKRWGISKIREDGDLHHAVDATVIACITNSMINKISDYSKYQEKKYSEVSEYVFDTSTGEVIDKFPFPYKNFRKELEIRTETEQLDRLHNLLEKLPNYTSCDIQSTNLCFVSRMQNHKVTGPAHQETIRSGKETGCTITKVALSALMLDGDGEIKNYYASESDTLLYNALKDRLLSFGGNGEKAFPGDYVFHKPKSNGGEGPIVKKVKIIEKSSLSVPVRNAGIGVAANGSMIRVDVFYVENDGYYFVPVYVADTVKSKLPCKACSRGKDGWKEMNDEDFLFSLYSNDLIKIRSKKEMKFSLNFKDSTLPKAKYANEIFVYYKNASISTASFRVETNDNSYSIPSLGIKTLLSIEKYSVDPIGNIHKVKKEKRMSFN